MKCNLDSIISSRTASNRILRVTLATLALAILYLALPNTAMADVSTCTNVGNKPWPRGNESYAIEMDRVKYLGRIASSSTDSQASRENGQYSINLCGWLYYKRSAAGEVKNSKVVTYNHGHYDARTEPCAIVKYFVEQGYVVFAPLRRGHFASASAKDGWQPLVSTGMNLDRYVDLCLRSYPVPSTWDRPHLNRASSDCRILVITDFTASFGGKVNTNARVSLLQTDFIGNVRYVWRKPERMDTNGWAPLIPIGPEAS